MTNVYISYLCVNSNLTVYYHYRWSGIIFQVDHSAIGLYQHHTGTTLLLYYVYNNCLSINGKRLFSRVIYHRLSISNQTHYIKTLHIIIILLHPHWKTHQNFKIEIDIVLQSGFALKKFRFMLFTIDTLHNFGVYRNSELKRYPSCAFIVI